MHLYKREAQESALDLVELKDRQCKPEVQYFMGSAPVHKDILKGLQSSPVFQKQVRICTDCA